MPEMGGEDATREIRKFSADVPIVAVTAIMESSRRAGFFDSGMNDVLGKPFKPDDLFQILAKHITGFTPPPPM